MKNDDLFIQSEIEGPFGLSECEKYRTPKQHDHEYLAKSKFTEMLNNVYDAIEIVSLQKGHISKQEAKYYFDKYTKLNEKISKLPKFIASGYQPPYHKDPKTYDLIINIMEYYKLVLLEQSKVYELQRDQLHGECEVYNNVYQSILVNQFKNESEQEDVKEI